MTAVFVMLELSVVRRPQSDARQRRHFWGPAFESPVTTQVRSTNRLSL